jgi:hypothetical protein
MNNKSLLDEAPNDELQLGGNAPDVETVMDLPDIAVESEPTDIDLQIAEEYDRLENQYGSVFVENFLAQPSPYDAVKWPMVDANAPDYANTASLSAPHKFVLDCDVLDRLISINGFSPFRKNGVLAFALRGATLDNGFDAEKVDSVIVLDVRPDHIHFKCLIGFYFLDDRKISVYTGSTVPCRKAVYLWPDKKGQQCNLLPNGLYTYFVWRHRTLRPALRLSRSNDSNSNLEQGQWATVLRTRDDKIFGIKDLWDEAQPYDNVHCSYYTSYNVDLGAYFSSWGCLTIRGKKTPTDQWEKFQDVLREIGSASQVDLMLLTGKDAALAALSIGPAPLLDANELIRLRVGSVGLQVKALQSKLGLEASGYFGYKTRKKLTDFQREMSSQNGGEATADGVYTPALDAVTGWGIFPGTSTSFSMLGYGDDKIGFKDDDTLRPIPSSNFTDSEPLPAGSEAEPKQQAAPELLNPLIFLIEPSDEPQSSKVRFYATESITGERFYVAQSTKYNTQNTTRIGLIRSSTLLEYDRDKAEEQIGLWAHFMWPTVMGESGGRHLTINSYDRAHFTWGFFQLAAHTPKDNLILLMRELLTLPSAAIYFPDLKLVNGRVHYMSDGETSDLEHEERVRVGSRYEWQITRFMRYMNPSSTWMDNEEIMNAAKFVHWATTDPEVVTKTIEVSLGILKRKALSYANRYGLFGRRPELAIWICDMFHQGRGSPSQVRAALALPTFFEQLEALSRIDTTENHGSRLSTVKKYVKILLDENRFNGVKFGEGELKL